ncbi:MAG: hypothetical protein H7Z16_00320 [Pyrinomonadaceae bacterium]|nr:hypothetical protein [Pyrinomonadaceae bacterium]
MKVLAIALALVAIVSITVEAAMAQQPKGDATIGQKAQGLELVLVVDKRKYKLSEELKLQVILVNPTSKPVYVFRTLDWGVSASLSLHLRGASGREIEPEFPPDAQTYDSPDDKSAFVKLSPDHFLGANFPASVKFLNFTRPGKYAISVEYTSPFSTTEVDLKPFLGKEHGPIKSNVVWIEVVR